MVRDLSFIVSENTIFSADTILAVDASSLSYDDFAAYLRETAKALDSIVFNFNESQKDELKDLLSRAEAERLTSGERRAIRKYAEDLRYYTSEVSDERYGELLERVEEYRQRVYDAYVKLGEKDQKNKDHKQAIGWFQSAVELYPKFTSDSYRGCGKSFSSLGKKRDAIFWCNQALAVNPKDAEACKLLERILEGGDDSGLERADFYFKKGKYRKAMRLCKKLSASDSSIKKKIEELEREIEEKADYYYEKDMYHKAIKLYRLLDVSDSSIERKLERAEHWAGVKPGRRLGNLVRAVLYSTIGLGGTVAPFYLMSASPSALEVGGTFAAIGLGEMLSGMLGTYLTDEDVENKGVAAIGLPIVYGAGLVGGLALAIVWWVLEGFYNATKQINLSAFDDVNIMDYIVSFGGIGGWLTTSLISLEVARRSWMAFAKNKKFLY